MSGRVAEGVIYGVALSDAEVAQLATGVSPLLVRPGDILNYYPLIGRASPEIDLVGGNNLTVTGAAAGAHTAMRYGADSQSVFLASAAPPALVRRRTLMGVGE
jgi:hypothetical protein